MTDDRVVVITGAAGGIGSALAERFLRNGDRVVALDYSQAALAGCDWQGTPAERLLSLESDVSDEADCARVAEAVRDRFGRVDILVNCAGYFPTGRIETMALADWRRVIDINLTGTFLMVRAVLPLMKGLTRGRIVNIGSASFFSGPPGRAHYVAAKGGVIGFTRSLASELGSDGITVNVVAPGLTVTEAVLRETPAELIAHVRENRPIKRDQAAEDVVGAVFFLASPEADFISGQVLNVDGGYSKH